MKTDFIHNTIIRMPIGKLISICHYHGINTWPVEQLQRRKGLMANAIMEKRTKEGFEVFKDDENHWLHTAHAQ